VGAGAGLQTIKDIRGNYGPAVFDRPHRLVVTWMYAPPFFQQKAGSAGKDRRRLANRGDWHVPGRASSHAFLVRRRVRRIARQSARRSKLAAQRADDRSMVRRQPTCQSGAGSAWQCRERRDSRQRQQQMGRGHVEVPGRRLGTPRSGMRTGTHMRVESRSRSATTHSNSDCGCATMAGGSTRRCSQARESTATTDYVACLNAPG
jgi:hypothetical protein